MIATSGDKRVDFSVVARREGDPQVVWIRFGNCSNALLLERVGALWPGIIAELEKGAPLVELQA